MFHEFRNTQLSLKQLQYSDVASKVDGLGPNTIVIILIMINSTTSSVI